MKVLVLILVHKHILHISNNNHNCLFKYANISELEILPLNAESIEAWRVKQGVKRCAPSWISLASSIQGEKPVSDLASRRRYF